MCKIKKIFLYIQIKFVFLFLKKLFLLVEYTSYKFLLLTFYFLDFCFSIL
mgnify:CR=1 FL=1